MFCAKISDRIDCNMASKMHHRRETLKQIRHKYLTDKFTQGGLDQDKQTLYKCCYEMIKQDCSE